MLEGAADGQSVTRAPLGLHTWVCQSDTHVHKALLCTGYLAETGLVVWASITTALHTANLVREERNPGLDLRCGERQKAVLGGL